MVQINFAQKQVNAKIVYYGPGMSGKTTNLEIVHQRAPTANRGDLTSISTDGDRTLFFDFMPLDLGTVAGMRTCFQIYTVPGQVYYNSTRKLVLQGVDGVVFVADSSGSMVQENLESLKNLEQNLNEYGKSLASLPHVIQFNKRDLPDAMTVDELSRLLNAHGAPCYEAVANTGQGVFPTLKALAARVLETIHTGSRAGTAPPAAAPLPSPAPAAVHAPVHAAAATGYNARPLHQTGYTPVASGTTGYGPAPIPMPARPSVPAAAQAHAPQTQVPMPRAPAHPGADTVSRTTIHAPPAPHAPAPLPMQSIPMAPAPGQHIVRGHPTPGSTPIPMPTAGGASNLQMMRSESPMAMPNTTAARPQPAAPARQARPAARPPAPRPIQPRPTAPKIATRPSGRKKSFTTVMLVVAALVAGAVMAVAVLS